MPTKAGNEETDRRTVLGLATLALTGGVHGLSNAGEAVAAASAVQPKPNRADVYEETEHVLAAYRRMRF
ncbi:hypothetical protein [Thalassobaculum sp.]|uniref:hypothetical protein n=1 Tax=Thalassobaculum sp. TaxID=2022740 RepID=UPI0032F050F5